MNIRGLGAALAVATAGGALLAAPASAGSATYAGDIDGGGKFAMDVVVKKGKVKEISSARAVDMSGACEISGDQTLSAETPEPIKVDKKGKFSYKFTQPEYGNVTTLKGKFKGEEVSGVINLDLHYLAEGDLPEEDCSTGPLDYEGESGAKDETGV